MFKFILLFGVFLDLMFFWVSVSCFKEGSFSECGVLLGASLFFIPFALIVGFLMVRGVVVDDWEMIQTLIKKILIHPR